VEFTIAEIESWLACLSVIGTEYVKFGGYNPSFTREEFGRAVDIQTLNQMIRLRNALRVTVTERNQPVPTALYIKPLLVCGWNKWKTGTDSVSRFLKTIAIYGDGQRNPHAWIHKRDLDQVLLNCFKLCQLVKVYDWMMGPEYKAWHQLRPRLNKALGSFKDFKWNMMKEMEKELQQTESTPTIPRSPNMSKVQLLKYFCSRDGSTQRCNGHEAKTHLQVRNRIACILCGGSWTETKPQFNKKRRVHTFGGRVQVRCSDCKVALHRVKKKQEVSDQYIYIYIMTKSIGERNLEY
jgi:hypothetical protein